MSLLAMQGGATGTGTVTLLAPSTSTNRTLTLPDSAGTVATAESTLSQFNASGSAPVYACRAWVNFNGTGTVAIRASGNVSSITDNGTGDYTVNFTTAMPDANYNAVTGVGAIGSTSEYASVINVNIFTTTSLRMRTGYVLSNADAVDDRSLVTISVFR